LPWRTYLAATTGASFRAHRPQPGLADAAADHQDEIEGKPIARQMRLAILPGYNLYVPQGKARRRHAEDPRPFALQPNEPGA
jgi:hypothetical protein